MKQSIELSKKKLNQLAENLNGTWLTGNVYAYENYIHDLSNLKKNESAICNNIIDSLIGKYPNIKYLQREQIAYSYGVYGNNGQLHQMIAVDDDENVLETLYVYY